MIKSKNLLLNMIETIIWKMKKSMNKVRPFMINKISSKSLSPFFRDTKHLNYRFVEIFQGINLISTVRVWTLAWLHKHVDTWSRSGSNRYRKFDRALSRVRSPGSLSIIQRPWLPYNPRILHLPPPVPTD